jgi:alanine racemase
VTFGIAIDAAAWQQHTEALRNRIHRADAALIPVIKGDGYGLGQALLAREATRLSLKAIAVGTVHEIASVLDDFAGDIIVLEPVDPRDTGAVAAWQQYAGTDVDARLIRTVATSEGLDFLLDTHELPRVIIEARTAMRRFGFDGTPLREAWQWASQAVAEGRLRLHGLTVHLPLAPTNADLDEILQWADEVGDSSLHILVSHIDIPQLVILRRHSPNLRFSLRVGTALWLGQREALQPYGTVLAVRRISKRDVLGYNRRPARAAGHVLVVGGGTAHGVGLAAPSPAQTLRQRIVALGLGVYAALGRAKSPFSFDGRELWFVEPPHQHVSMLWLPASVTPPAVGTELPAVARFTTTHPDVVELR